MAVNTGLAVFNVCIWYIMYIFSVPLAITSLTEEISNNTSIHLHWTSPDMNTSLFRHFIVNVKSAFGSLNWELNGNQSELGVTDLNLGSMYNVTVYVSTGYEISSPLQKTFYTCK